MLAPIQVQIVKIDRCPEDEFLIGTGSFSHTLGRWSAYTCGPALDDVKAASFSHDADT